MKERLSMPRPVLPDLLAPGLRVVFCGTAAGPMSAALGQYYAHPQNKFWRALHEIGLTPYQLAPEDYPKLLTWGIGLTDIGKHVSGLDRDLPRGSLGAEACADLRKRLETFAPKTLAFTSLNAGKKFLRRATLRQGKQAETLGDTAIWVLPSPSPLALWRWDIGPWRELAASLPPCC